jgi:hypothetical protein
MEKVVPLFKPFKTKFYFNFPSKGKYILDQSKFEGIWTYSKLFELRLNGLDRFESVQTRVLCRAAHVLAVVLPAPVTQPTG